MTQCQTCRNRIIGWMEEQAPMSWADAEMLAIMLDRDYNGEDW